MKKIFIGSSNEAIGVARHLQSLLETIGVEVTCWPESFRVSGYTLDEILDASKKHSAGIFVLNKDDCVVSEEPNGKKYVARDNVLVEAGLFCGALGIDSVALCCLDDVHVPSDFSGVTRLQYNPMNINSFTQKLKEWVDLKVKDAVEHTPNNVNMLSRIDIQDLFPIDYRLHISDNIYKKIRHIRMMNFASTLFLDLGNGDYGHVEQMKELTLANAIDKIMNDTKADFDLILTEPTNYNLIDVKTKIANHRAMSPEGAVLSSLESIKMLLTKDSIYKTSNTIAPKRFTFKTINTSIPFAVFGVEYLTGYEEYSHVKVDLYSAALQNEDERRSFVIWKSEDPENYKFFINNFDKIFGKESLCYEPKISDIEKWLNKYRKYIS